MRSTKLNFSIKSTCADCGGEVQAQGYATAARIAKIADGTHICRPCGDKRTWNAMLTEKGHADPPMSELGGALANATEELPGPDPQL